MRHHDWRLTPNFGPSEFACRCGKCGGLHDMDPKFMGQLQALRDQFGRPMRVTSGFRCPLHKIEAKKKNPGSHGQGLAADIACANSLDRYDLVRLAFVVGMRGIGINEEDGFVHLDGGHAHMPRPALWEYR